MLTATQRWPQGTKNELGVDMELLIDWGRIKLTISSSWPSILSSLKDKRYQSTFSYGGCETGA